jgi:hypothetical protein
MPSVNIIKSEDERTLPEHAAIEAYVLASDQGGATVLVRKAQRLDVDEVLARSLPSPGAYANKELKTNPLR